MFRLERREMTELEREAANRGLDELRLLAHPTWKSRMLGVVQYGFIAKLTFSSVASSPAGAISRATGWPQSAVAVGCMVVAFLLLSAVLASWGIRQRRSHRARLRAALDDIKHGMLDVLTIAAVKVTVSEGQGKPVVLYELQSGRFVVIPLDPASPNSFSLPFIDEVDGNLPLEFSIGCLPSSRIVLPYERAEHPCIAIGGGTEVGALPTLQEIDVESLDPMLHRLLVAPVVSFVLHDAPDRDAFRRALEAVPGPGVRSMFRATAKLTMVLSAAAFLISWPIFGVQAAVPILMAVFAFCALIMVVCVGVRVVSASGYHKARSRFIEQALDDGRVQRTDLRVDAAWSLVKTVGDVPFMMVLATSPGVFFLIRDGEIAAQVVGLGPKSRITIDHEVVSRTFISASCTGDPVPYREVRAPKKLAKSRTVFALRAAASLPEPLLRLITPTTDLHPPAKSPP